MRLAFIAATVLIGTVGGGALAHGQVVAYQGRAARVPVYVSTNAQSTLDQTGRLLAYRVREELRQSTGMSLAETDTQGAVIVELFSRETPCGDPSEMSIASVAVYVNNGERTMIDHFLQDVGRTKVDAVARRIVADVDSELVKWRARISR